MRCKGTGIEDPACRSLPSFKLSEGKGARESVWEWASDAASRCGEWMARASIIAADQAAATHSRSRTCPLQSAPQPCFLGGPTAAKGHLAEALRKDASGWNEAQEQRAQSADQSAASCFAAMPYACSSDCGLGASRQPL
jgi:hypothetical protein